MVKILQKGSNIDLSPLDQSQVCVTDMVNEKNDQVPLLTEKLKRVKDTLVTERHCKLMEETKAKSTVKKAE